MQRDGLGRSLDIGADLKDDPAPKEPSPELPAQQENNSSKEGEPEESLEEDVEGLLSSPGPVLQKPRSNGRRNLWLCLLIVLLVGGISLAQSLLIPGITDRAENSFDNTIRAAAQEQVAKDWPLLAPEAQARKAQEIIQEALRNPDAGRQKAAITRRLQDIYRTAKGIPYVYDLDSYFFLALASGIDTNRVQFQNAWNTFAVIEKFAFKTWHSIDPLVTISDTTFFLPLIFGLITLAAVFGLAFLVTRSTETAFFAGIALALHHRFFFATAAGMADTQSINLMFTALFFFFTALCVRSWQDRRPVRALTGIICAGVIFSLFLKAWGNGANYLFAVLGIAVFATLAFVFLRSRSWIKLGVLCAGGIAAFVWAVSTNFGQRALGYLGFSNNANVLFIGELYGGSINVLAVALGGWLPFLIALAAGIWLVRKNSRQPAFLEMLVVVWFVLLSISTYQAVRFVYYALPPTALLIGIGLQRAVTGARNLFDIESGTKSHALRIAALFLLALLLIPYLIATQHKVVPYMNDAIVQVGSRMEASTSPDARIISWWDYGHVWRYASRRNPFIDGGLQGHHATFWTARAFLSHDAEESKRIWSFLPCAQLGWLGDTPPDLSLLQNNSCVAQNASAIIVDENMLGDSVAAGIAQTVALYDFDFATGTIKTTPIVTCAGTAPLLSCGGLDVNLETLRAADGTPVHYYANSTRTTTNATSERVAVVFRSGDAHAAFVTTSWLADTMLVRLLAGDTLGFLEPVAVVDIPQRIVAYKYAPRVETEEDVANMLVAGLAG